MVIINSNNLLEVTQVKPSKINVENLYGFNIDQVNCGKKGNPFIVTITGWVVGKFGKAINLEILFDDTLLRKIPIDVKRPDVLQKHVDWLNAETSGFKAQIDTVNMPTSFQLNLRVILVGNLHIDIGIIKFQSSYYYRHFYFVNHNYRFVYCSIPKNACTLFKTFTLENSNDKAFRKESDNIHTYIARKNREIKLKDLSILNDKSYFKFVILRNPFDRLLSAYLDKFVNRRHPEQLAEFAKKVIKKIYNSRGLEVDYYRGITFSQLVYYLCNTEDIFLDQHLKPQYLFLGSIKFEYYGQFERLNEVITYIENRFNVKIDQKVSNHRTLYSNPVELKNNLNYHDLYASDLRELNLRPRTKQIYTPKLIDLVKQKYARDIEIYTSQFSSPVTEGVIMQKSGDIATFKTYVDKVIQLKKEGNLASAIEKLSKALQLKPNSIPVLNNLAGIYESRKEFDQAITYLQRVIKFQPDNGIAHARLAKAMMAQRNIQGAIASYQKALALQPEQPVWVYIGMGDALNQNGQVDEAIAAYQKAIELSPDNPNPYQRVAQLYSQKGQLDNAINSYQKAIRLKPDLPFSICASLAKALKQQGREEEAFTLLKATKEGKEGEIYSNIWKALNQTSLGNLDEERGKK